MCTFSTASSSTSRTSPPCSIFTLHFPSGMFSTPSAPGIPARRILAAAKPPLCTSQTLSAASHALSEANWSSVFAYITNTAIENKHINHELFNQIIYFKHNKLAKYTFSMQYSFPVKNRITQYFNMLCKC